MKQLKGVKIVHSNTDRGGNGLHVSSEGPVVGAGIVVASGRCRGQWSVRRGQWSGFRRQAASIICAAIIGSLSLFSNNLSMCCGLLLCFGVSSLCVVVSYYL